MKLRENEDKTKTTRPFYQRNVRDFATNAMKRVLFLSNRMWQLRKCPADMHLCMENNEKSFRRPIIIIQTKPPYINMGWGGQNGSDGEKISSPLLMPDVSIHISVINRFYRKVVKCQV